jgi:heptosyltransferase-2
MRDPSPSPILVCAFPRIGDFIMCHPLIQLLRARHPDRPIDVLAKPPGIAVAELMPEVRHAIVDPTPPGHLHLGERMALARRLRQRGYGTAVIVSRAWKTALVPFLAGIPERIGWFGEARLVTVNRLRFDERRYTGTVGRATALALMRGEAAPASWPEPRLVIPPAMMAAWQARHGGGNARQPLLAIAPGASTFDKIWPTDRYAALAKHFATRGWRIRVVGGPHEQRLGETIRAAVDAEVLIQDSVLDLACAIGSAQMFVGNDSGPLHLAAALGKPALGVFGPTDCRPINRHVEIIAPANGPSRDWADTKTVIAQLETIAARIHITP